MSTRRTAAALLGLSLVLASCAADDGSRSGAAGDRLTHTSGSVRTAAPAEASPTPPGAVTGTVTGPTDGPEAVPTPTLRPRRSRTAEDWGPSPAELRRASRVAARMPLPRLAGQVIVAEYDGQ